MAMLYAWATPTPFAESPVDHTWVTDYDNRINAYPDIAAVIAAAANYWFCWGDFHKKVSGPAAPEGFLGEAAADTTWANCLCESNVPSDSKEPSCGAIFHYGVDGVCHQLANEVLWATGAGGSKALTVSKARGYSLSTFFYGTYGLQQSEWAARKARCMPKAAPETTRAQAMSASSADEDEFMQHARAVLDRRNSEHKLQKLLALREQSRGALASHRAAIANRALEAPSADHLNAQHQARLKEAAAVLTSDEFREIFGILPEEINNVQLVDPAIFRAAKK